MFSCLLNADDLKCMTEIQFGYTSKIIEEIFNLMVVFIKEVQL